jgi:hypothetical protein
MATYLNGKPIPEIYNYSQTSDGKKTVTLDVVTYEGYDWAVIHRYRDGDVLGMKLPLTGSPATEPWAWKQLRFAPESSE